MGATEFFFKNISETDTISDVQKDTIDISLDKKSGKRAWRI